MKLQNKKFSSVRRINYPKSKFDLSHSHQGSYDWGYLYPIFYEEATPGDYFEIGEQIVAKMMPKLRREEDWEKEEGRTGRDKRICFTFIFTT